MALIYQPNEIFMSPNNTAVDPSVDNDFDTIIDGKFCIAYNLFIYDTENTQVYTTNRVDISTLYDDETLSVTIPSSTLTAGEEYSWKIRLYANDVTISSIDTGTDILTASNHGFVTGDLVVFQATTTLPTGITAHTPYYVRKLSSSTFAVYETNVAARTNGTKLDITSAGSGTITASNVSKDSIQVTFYSVSDSSTSLTISSPHGSQEIEAIPTYTQTENVQVKYFRARLFDSNDNTLVDSGNIYSSNVRYTFDGLLDDSTYKIQFDVENDLGDISTTGLISFTVDYTEPSTDLVLTVENVEDKSAILLSWNAVMPTATVTGTETYIDDFIYTGNKGVQLETGENIAWDGDVSVDFDGTQHFIIRKDDLSTGIFYRMDNDYDSTYIEIGWDGTNFYTIEDGVTINWDGYNALKQFDYTELQGIGYEMLEAYDKVPNTTRYYLFTLRDNKLYIRETTI